MTIRKRYGAGRSKRGNTTHAPVIARPIDRAAYWAYMWDMRTAADGPAARERGIKMSIWSCPVPDPNFDANQAARIAVFNKIAPAPNWKMPVDCWIDAADFNECAQACVFFTGSKLQEIGR